MGKKEAQMTQTFAASRQPKSQPAPGEWTYQDYLNLPDDGRRYEIIEGILYVTNAPDIDHQVSSFAWFGYHNQYPV